MSLAESILTVVFITFVISAIFVQRTVSLVTAGDGTAIPLLEPSLWSFWLPFLIAVLALEVVFELTKYRMGRWTWGLASVNLALNVLFAVPAIYLLTSGRLLNPEFFEDLGWPDGADPGGPTVLIAVVIIAAVSVWDIVDGFRRARP